MGMYDHIQFQTGFSTDVEIPDEVLTGEWGQTKQLFSSLDFYQFRKTERRRGGQWLLHRMFPPISRTDEERGNKGQVGKFVSCIDEYREEDSIEDYAEWWIPVYRGSGYLDMLFRQDEYHYRVCATVNDGILEEIVPYEKRHREWVNDDVPEGADQWERNLERVREIKENRSPVVN